MFYQKHSNLSPYHQARKPETDLGKGYYYNQKDQQDNKEGKHAAQQIAGRRF
jgi:hypothetical protein